MTIYDALYLYLMFQLAGFIIGLTYSFFFHWVGWR